MDKCLATSEDDNSGLNVHWTANALLHDEEREPARRKRTKKAMLTELLRQSTPQLLQSNHRPISGTKVSVYRYNLKNFNCDFR